jgi:hypothetical protein
VQSLTPEALEEWKANPTTEFILSVLSKGAAVNRAALERTLWSDGKCDPEAMGRVKAQIELLEDLTDATVEEWNDWFRHFEEHKRDFPV